MKLSLIHLLRTLLLALFVASSCGNLVAQPSPAQCLGNIQKRLEALGLPADFDYLQMRVIMKNFDFGKIPAAVADPKKAEAFKRVITSLSEFCDAAGTSLSAKGMRGYTRLSGGVIRSDGTDFISDLKKVFGNANFDGAGFNGVMAHLDGKGKWLTQGKWESPEGLIFDVAPANRQGHRLSHVFTHTVPAWNGRLPADHSVFSIPRKDLLQKLDEAWKRKPAVDPDDPGAFLIDMGNEVVGTAGEKKILIIVRQNSNEILTAYPQP